LIYGLHQDLPQVVFERGVLRSIYPPVPESSILEIRFFRSIRGSTSRHVERVSRPVHRRPTIAGTGLKTRSTLPTAPPAASLMAISCLPAGPLRRASQTLLLFNLAVRARVSIAHLVARAELRYLKLSSGWAGFPHKAFNSASISSSAFVRITDESFSNFDVPIQVSYPPSSC